MRNITVLIGIILLLSACAGVEEQAFDPRTAISGTGVDVTALPDLGSHDSDTTANATDGIITYDYSASAESRITEHKFSGVANEFLDGQGNWLGGVLASEGTFTGNVFVGDSSTSTQSRYLDVGQARTGDGISWVDLVGDTTYSDYGFRMIRYGGANAASQIIHKGTGIFTIKAAEAGTIQFSTTDTLRGQFPAGGGFQLAAGTSIAEFSTDGTAAGNSDDAAMTEKAVVTYVTNHTRETSKLDLTADTSITEAQILANKYITNQGGAGEADLTLPAVSYPIPVIFVVEEVQNIEINPPTGEFFDLDGINLDANDCVDSDSTVGSKIVATRMQDASATWRWSLDTARGAWIDTGASD